MKAIDLYSGIGGWALGLKMAGIEVIAGYDLWGPAVDTYNANFGTDHRPVDLRNTDPLELHKPNEIDIIVGSPPCTQFSFANRGGSGDIDDGLVDIRVFLDFVEKLKPKYWAMENVPRVAGILDRHLFNDDGTLYRYKHLCDHKDFSIDVINCADLGIPQKRKRMIAGVYPSNLLQSYAGNLKYATLGNVIKAISNKSTITDPNYGSKLKRSKLKDHLLENPFTTEEVRINKEMKTHHPVYNKMRFPDELNGPARTVTATCTKVSRESIVINGPKKGQYRRLTVRERACIQSFPLNFQFISNSYNAKLKMVGNAIPPLLTYYIGKSIQKAPTNKINANLDLRKCKFSPNVLGEDTGPEISRGIYPKKRRFRYAIPNLRFGSGMRFELTNVFKGDTVSWRVDYYFNSAIKGIKISLNKDILDKSIKLLGLKKNKLLNGSTMLNKEVINNLQDVWTHREKGVGPFEILDNLGGLFWKLEPSINKFDKNRIDDHIDKLHIERLDTGDHIVQLSVLNDQKPKLSPKIKKNARTILNGFIIGSWFNSNIN